MKLSRRQLKSDEGASKATPRQRRLLRTAVLVPLLAATLPLTTEAGRPLTVDDAEPVEHRRVEVEAGTMFSNDGPLRHWDFPIGIAYGLAPQWEISVSTGGHLEERVELATGDNLATGISDAILGTKVKVGTQKQLFADHALALAVKIPTGSRHYGLSTGEVDVDLMWIATRQLTENTSFHLNAGYIWLGDPPGETLSDVFHAGIAAGWQCCPHLELVAEMFGNVPVASPDATQLLVNGGVRWQIAQAFALDAALGAGVRGEAPNLIATLGFTWSFN